MDKPFSSDLERIKQMMEQLNSKRSDAPMSNQLQVPNGLTQSYDGPAINEQVPSMPESIQNAIIGVESGGKSDAIGDIGFKAGDSRGLMQIQDHTARGLLANGLLPKEWKGKKVKKKDLPQLLLDPEFNKTAGAALYNDNRKMLLNAAKKRQMELTPEQEKELLIKAHNQGMPKTIRRDLYGDEPVNPKVQEYLNKVKSRAYADGGTVEPNYFDTPEEYAQRQEDQFANQFSMMPDMGQMVAQPAVQAPASEELLQTRESGEPASIPSPADPYADLLAQYKVAAEEDRKRKEMVDTGNAGIDIANQLAKFGTMRTAGQIQRAGAVPIELQAPTAEKIKAPEKKSESFLKQADMLKKLKELQTGKATTTKTVNTVNEKGEPVTQLITQTGAVLKEFKTPKKEVTPYQEETLKLWKKSIDTKEKTAEQNRQLRIEKEDQRQKEKDLTVGLRVNENIYRVTKDFEGNKVKQEMDKQGISFGQADQLIKQVETGNEVALGGLGIKMARAMGEVGVITNEDVKRYIASQSILRQGKDYYARLGKGKLYDKTLKDIKDINRKMAAGFKEKEKEILERYVSRAYENFGKHSGMSQRDIYKRFGMEHKVPLKAPSDTQVKKYMEMNPSLTQEQAIRILTNRLNK